MKKISKISIALVSLLILNGCSQIGSEISQGNVATQETLGSSNVIKATLVEPITLGISIENIPDIIPYVDTLTNEEINNNLERYIENIWTFTFMSTYIDDERFQEDFNIENTFYQHFIEEIKFLKQYVNKRYPLDLTTEYPIVDEYYRMINDEVQQKLDTLTVFGNDISFNYERYPNHDELEQQYEDFIHDYYSNVIEEKIQSLGYPFQEITVNNNLFSEIIPLEKECMEKFDTHYNGLSSLNAYWSIIFTTATWGEINEDAVGIERDYAKGIMLNYLMKYKFLTKNYQGIVGEDPEFVSYINIFIKEYSDVYMRMLSEIDSVSDNEVNDYVKNNLLETQSKLQDLLNKVLFEYQTTNLDELLVPVD